MGSCHRQLSALVILIPLAFTCCVAPECFLCFSGKVQGCGDHFALPNTEADFCDGTCVKMRGERYSDSVRIVEVTRTCIAQREEGCYSDRWNGLSVEACACNTDFCNSAPTTPPLLGGLLMQVFLAGAVGWLCL
ncbi:hypothetical protein ACOMHN_016848 [Nucella lapillus]